MGSPVKIASIAALRPMMRGKRNSPPAPAMRLRFTSANPNAERVLATTMSAVSTISHPPAVAKPSTATITGFLRSRYTKPAKPPRLVLRSAALPELIAFKSAPAQNTGRSWPVVLACKIAIHTLSSASSWSIAASSPDATSPFTALRASGRFSEMTATLPLTS